MHRYSALRRHVAARLEAGTFPRSPISRVFPHLSLSRAVADAWAARARLETPLVWNAASKGGPVVVTIGGATIGGGGKTRLALSVVASLADEEMIVCLLGHAYKAAPGVARTVHLDDDPRIVGDEALACAKSLATQANAHVVVGETRQAALDFAVNELGARVVVVDGVVQTSPRRADLALLVATDFAATEAMPCPPLGDARAARARLLEATDLVVSVPPALAVLAERAEGAGRLFAGARVGLVTALARPGRIEACLAGIGVVPEVHVALGDHARATRFDRARLRSLVREHRLDAWIATDKCRSAFAVDARISLGAPLFTLVPKIAPLPIAVRTALTRAMGPGIPLHFARPQAPTDADLDRHANGWAS